MTPIYRVQQALNRASSGRSGPSAVALLLVAGSLLAGPTAAPGTVAISGSLSGYVHDEQGKPVAGASLVLENRVSGYHQTIKTDAKGHFVLFNMPKADYHLEVGSPGFEMIHRDITIHSNLPLELDLTLKFESATVVVEDSVNLIEAHPSSHLDIDQSTIDKIPAAVHSRAMESILLATPGFIQDENGRFHFRGSHGQVMYVVDGVPITDQVQATFSNSMDPSQVDSMEVITGGISAEFGGKPGAVVNITSKSGLGAPGGIEGDVSMGVSRFNTTELGFSVRGCTDTFGYFVTGGGSQSDRFLDPVNFENLHNHGTTGRLFSRFDWVFTNNDTARFSASGGQTNRDVVNLASQEANGQDQRVDNKDANLSLGWTHLFDATMSLDTSLFYRHSTSRLIPTQELAAGFTGGGPDFPFWASQDRSLDNEGIVTALTRKSGDNTFKAGLQYVRYPIHERFAFAITDPTGAGFVDPTDPSAPLRPYLPYDPVTNPGGGQIFRFDDSLTPTLASAFVQDDVKAGNWNLGLGLRFDSYKGRNFTQDQLQPRVGIAYNVPSSGTLFRLVYDRLMITPENEGLALSTSQLAWTTTSGQNTPVAKLRPELQDSYLVGVEQQIGKVAKVSLEYWWKDSTNAADNSQFLNTGVLFPIAAAKGKFHGLDLRFDVVPIQGWSGYLSAGTVRTLFYNPTVGGLDAATTANNTNAYLIDHDQKLTMQLGVRYEHQGFYGQVIGRYDSGLEAGDPTTVAGNPDYAFGIPYVRAEQDSLVGLNYRVKPRTVWDFSLGQEFKLAGKRTLAVGLDLLNAFDEQGLYNFLSTFGGTHVIPPRTLAVHVKWKF